MHSIRIAYVTAARGHKTYGAFAEEPSLHTTVYDVAHRRSRAENFMPFLRIARSLLARQRPHAIIWDTFAVYTLPVMWLARWRRTLNLVRLRGNTLAALDEELRQDGVSNQEQTARLQRSITRRVMQRADCLLPVAEHLAAEMLAQAGLSGIPYVALPTYVDVDRFKPVSPAEQAAARRRLGLADDAPILLTLTNFAYWEKVRPLLDFLPAFEQLCAQYPTIRWLIGGRGKHRARFVQELSASPVAAQMTALDWIDNPVDYLHGCDLLVHFSQLEGLPNVIIEAAACGKAVIANPYPGMQACVVEGETGFLVDPRDVTATCRAIRDYLDDKARQARMGQAARALAVNHFSAAAIAARFIAILAEMGVQTAAAGQSPPSVQHAEVAEQQ